MAFRLLSKSRYLTGLQCPRYVWMVFHEPDKIPATDEVTQYIFDQGQEVGYLAKQLFAGGIDVSQDDFMGNIRQTRILLEERKPIFEAGIMVNKLYSRVDILFPADDYQWDIFEVKSSTSVKQVHIDDVAFQRHCCKKAGLKIRNCYLVLINNQYIRNGEVDPEGLFNIHDVTDKVSEAILDIEDKIQRIIDIIQQDKSPEMIIGPHCQDPYECPLTDCWEHMPEDSVFTLYWSGKKAFDMYDAGITNIKDIPEEYKLNKKQLIQKTALIDRVPYIEKEPISEFLDSLEYPLYYLDFETIGPAIPLFDTARPYQNVPFQYSLHVVQKGGIEPIHYSYLHKGPGDPRPELLAELKKSIGATGSVIAYNKGFEEGCLRDAAEAYPEYAEWFEDINNRMVDLLTPFSNFHYYHPAQQGSASLKRVLPAITGIGYDGLEINDGQIASMAYMSANYGDNPEVEKNKIFKNLEEYCGRDTEGMIWIIEKLRKLSDKS
ncbi:MAG: DUF2779 domain-containing protein [Dehalococcoidales bacterium]|nr:MAG: DUF2779 domain-containing protein [Dehalococcoidales bacterium]